MGQKVMTQKIIKNFLITGTPRSSSTWFCKTLNSYDRIWMPEFKNYEPFNPHIIRETTNALKVNLYDQNAFMDKIIEAAVKREVDYLGVKSFPNYHTDLSLFLNDYDVAIIVLIRKDIWKVLGSLFIAVDNKNFLGSSKRFKPYFWDKSPRETRRLVEVFHRQCKNYWYAENYFSNHKNFVDKIYMEDIVKGKSSFKNIDNYFGKRIEFESDYTEDDLSKYFENFEEIKKFIVELCKSAPFNYSVLPSYILEQLDL
jgi:hypothetical protein